MQSLNDLLVINNLLGDVVQVIASVLDTEDDEEGHLACLHIIQDLMLNTKGIFKYLYFSHRRGDLRLDWIELDWIGLDWIGSDWIEVDWIGLDFKGK